MNISGVQKSIAAMKTYFLKRIAMAVWLGLLALQANSAGAVDLLWDFQCNTCDEDEGASITRHDFIRESSPGTYELSMPFGTPSERPLMVYLLNDELPELRAREYLAVLGNLLDSFPPNIDRSKITVVLRSTVSSHWLHNGKDRAPSDTNMCLVGVSLPGQPMDLWSACSIDKPSVQAALDFGTRTSGNWAELLAETIRNCSRQYWAYFVFPRSK